ncbi:MAG: sigma-54 dependent transcriptional regulator [Nitrospirae bacterium]|nr:sigma-54 dependent transcriptional regulator [Nitrospirota bacterium]MCL5422209.1 sigma-54 dependent transcriptional regulator [Nitrospirota bacterium]
MSSILVVDDDRTLCNVLRGLLENAGFDVRTAYNVDAAESILQSEDLDLIITDLKMPGKSGMDLLTECKMRRPAVPVIMITAYGHIEDAVAAMKQGAYDFISKPFDEDDLLNVIKKALNESLKNRELVSAYFDKESTFSAHVIGDTPAVKQTLQTVRKIGPTDSTVLITGETGVGKELIARALHLASPRRNQPLIKVNCAAIPESLLESELFGYEKGAFTGAVTAKPGRFEIAHKGTIFLDEIGDMPHHLQAKLLGVIQDRAFERVGGVKTIRVDIRIIAATNTDLQSAVRSGKFRPDLFYRLNVVPIHIPPLRERKDDLVILVHYFLGRFIVKYRKQTTAVSPEVMAALAAYDWPGNIRELENVLERMVLMSETDILGLELMPEEIRGSGFTAASSTLKEKIDTVSHLTEKQMIIDALNKTNQNRTKAAELLGISRRTLQNKIKEYGL